MSAIKAVRRTALALLVLVVIAAVVAGVLGVTYARRPFPQTSGKLEISGLTTPVTVFRDDRGVPQIWADNADDLFRAQGFVAAQDRFFEMDVRRHVTSGRLSELVGESGLETDKVVRTLGWRDVAEDELPRLQPATRRYLQAYAEGVNAWIEQAGTPGEMAVEYLVLEQRNPGYRVEPWSPADSLAWLKAMAWDLKGNYRQELTRARLSERLPRAQLDELFPPYPTDVNTPVLSPQAWSPALSPEGSSEEPTGEPTGESTTSPTTEPTTPPTEPSAGTTAEPTVEATPTSLTQPSARKDAEAAYDGVARALAAVPPLVGQGEGIGSNAWVVGSDHSTTGRPLLANDPHLGVSVPGIWHQVGLHCRQVTKDCPFEVSGFSFAGAPGVVIGHNARIAWGFTNLDPDVTDFYLERIEGDTYERDGEDVPLTKRTETIKVAGGPSQTITVRSTGHGPILSDVIEGVADAGAGAPVNGRQSATDYDVSLAWTGLVPSKTADAIFLINRADNFDEFRSAARYFSVPSQNLVYADVDGHIGYQAPGRVPIRRATEPGGIPGYWPAPGWDSDYDWKGWVPFEDLPWTLDPAEGFIVSANQAVTSGTDPFLTVEWDRGYRARRIRDLLEAEGQVTPDRMAQIQGDTRHPFAPLLVKALLKIDVSQDPFTVEAQELLRGWDFTTPAGNSDAGAAAAYYNAVWVNLLRLTFDDELPEDLRASGGDKWMLTVARMLDKPRSAWWDNKQTPGVLESRDEILRQSLREARLELTRDLGKEPSTWEWGKLHRLTLEHKVLGGESVPGPLRWLVNRGPYQMPGGSAIVNANGWTASAGFEVDWAPSMRMVVDLGDLDDSRWVNQTGVSGHPGHPHYDDQIKAWVANDTFPWPFTEQAVRAAADETQELVPRSTTQP